MSPTANQKVEDECQDKRTCHFSVNSRLFGPDPCPGTHKYLLITYKCRPDNHKTKTVCENKKLKLQCNNKMVLAIYSASYGRWHQSTTQCSHGNSTQPDIECLSKLALKKVSRRCHNKQNCTFFADKATFGDPCYPGVNKQLSISYMCVPKQLLEEANNGQRVPDPFSLADYTHGLPEKVGLYFVCGVCTGLVFLFCLFGSKIPIKHDIIKFCTEDESKGDADHVSGKLKEEEEEDAEDDSSSESSFRHLTRTYHVSENIFSPDITAKMVARAEQRQQDEEDIWLQQESSPYSIHKVKSATK
ncbi:protein eva-1 homolog C-like isoform X1 [Protopterus annectens]|uniref:protein eva-1 homolog C-like isoform X1 n=1 Tax=Protopterus annectens TaxID=7888 RepID=UPI001CF99B1A|nr:protein eva-1 homolog C-like isoform X1 [Protopterus annectens]